MLQYFNLKILTSMLTLLVYRLMMINLNILCVEVLVYISHIFIVESIDVVANFLASLENAISIKPVTEPLHDRVGSF